MIPYAELINHENVDVMYDYLDAETGKTLTQRRENRKVMDKEARLYHLLKQRLFLEDLQNELQKMESDLKAKMRGEEVREPTAAEKEE
jgi:glycerol-3-phosphate O-acyltransferase